MLGASLLSLLIALCNVLLTDICQCASCICDIEEICIMGHSHQRNVSMRLRQSFLHVFCPICPNLRRLLVCIDCTLNFLSTPQQLNGQTALRCQCNVAQQRTDGQTAVRCQCNVVQQRSDSDETVKSEFKSQSHGDIALVGRAHNSCLVKRIQQVMLGLYDRKGFPWQQ